MASIDRTRDGWRARWRTPEGASRSQNFKRKADAERFLTTIEATKLVGGYVDPAAGRVTFAEFAEGWLSCQTFDPSTREAVSSRLRVHLIPTLGSIQLRHIRPSTVQAWLRGRQEACAPRYARVMLANLSAILGAAVEDDLIQRNPCRSSAVRAPVVPPKKIIPWSVVQVAAVVEAHPERWRAMPLVAAGCGLRQGEVFGLRVEDLDFLRHRVLVRQQVKLLGGAPLIAPPKGRKTREVPLPGRRRRCGRTPPAVPGDRRAPVHEPGAQAGEQELLQPPHLEAGAPSRRRRAHEGERHARPEALLRQRPA